MVSTHAWKATISSPLPSTTNSTSTQQQQSSSSSGSNIGNTGGMGFGSSTSKGIGGSSSTSSTSSSTFIGSNYNPKQSAPTAMGGVATHDFESLLSNSTSLLTSMGRNNGGGGISGLGGGMMSASGGTHAFGSTAHQSSSSSSSTSSSMALGDKSLLELNVASRTPSFPNGPHGIHAAAASGTGTTATTYEAEASAHRLFAREGWGFDSARLGRRARELERRANVGGASSSDDGGGTTRMEEEKKEGGFDRYGEGGGGGGAAGGSNGGGGMERHPLADLSGASLHRILSSHHEYCVRTALRQAREWTVDQAESRTEEKIEGDWEEERRRILGRGVLGHRFLAGSGGGRGGGGAMGAKGGVASRVPLLEGDAGAAGGAASGTSSSPYGDIAPSSQPLPGGAEGLVKSHLASIDKHLTAVSAPSSQTSAAANAAANAATLLASLQEGAEDAVVATANSGTNPERARGYSNALSLLRSIAHCRATLETSAGPGPGPGPDPDSDVAAGVAGACDFFARQFASHVGAAVRDAELAGMRSQGGYAGRNAAARDVCAFATLAAGGDVAEGRGGVWLKLFYCLRCGDLVAANSILQQFGTAATSEDMSHVDPSVSNIVSQLAQLQQTRETIFGDGTHGNARPARPPASSLLHPTQPMLHARRTVADLYQRTNARSSHSAEEPFRHYRTACLAMLGGAESISEAPALASSGLVKTVEDYLYAALWHAICLADGDSVGGMGSAGTGGGLRRVSEAVARLGVLVDRWGPSHFERDDARAGSAADAVANAGRGGTLGGRGEGPSPSGGWAYALPLLASQRYATALAYVAEAGGGLGLLQAAHLGVVMDAAGLSIGDFSLEGGAADAGRAESQRRLLPVLVASYSASLQGADAGAALKYLVLLSDKGKFVKEQVQRLLLETHQFTTLAGTIQPDGSRSLAALDAYFSKKRVSALLVDAAHHAMRAGKPADAAELLVLSGRFGALFELMNRELASYLNAATPEDFEKRQFWFRAASQFHAIHLATGRTYVQTALDDDGNLSLGNTFQLLMNLVVFFDRCREQQWEGAWVLMDNLQLLPKTESEMTVKLEAFRALDNCVRRVFHHVVLSAMEALCHLFRTTKQSGGGAVAGGAASNINLNQQNAIDQRLDEFRTRARLLVTFARLLNLPSLGDGDTYVRISQLEKNMM